MRWIPLLAAISLSVAPARAQDAVILPPVAHCPPGAPRTLCDKWRDCRRKCCQTTIGQLFHNILAPARVATGGLIGDCCSPCLTRDEIARLGPCDLSPPELAAAKIQADEAGAHARRAAVRYLGTVDCHYYPEAEAALIAALRADRNECVRLEAARALGNGCCCNPRTLAALNLVVSGSDIDGNPTETSERVKRCALDSMKRCLAAGVAFLPPPPTEKGPSATPTIDVGREDARPDGITLASFTVPAAATSADAARRRPETVSAPARAPRTGQRSLFNLFAATSAPVSAATPTPPAPINLPVAPPPILRGPDSLSPIGVFP